MGEMNSSGLTRWPLVLRDGLEGKATWRLDGWAWSLGFVQEVWAGATSVESKVQSPRSGPGVWPSWGSVPTSSPVPLTLLCCHSASLTPSSTLAAHQVSRDQVLPLCLLNSLPSGAAHGLPSGAGHQHLCFRVQCSSYFQVHFRSYLL